MQAALGLAQLERLDELIERKHERFGWYKEELSDIPGLILNPESPDTRNAFWMFTVVLDPSFGIEKGYLQEQLSARAFRREVIHRRICEQPREPILDVGTRRKAIQNGSRLFVLICAPALDAGISSVLKPSVRINNGGAVVIFNDGLRWSLLCFTGEATDDQRTDNSDPCSEYV